MLLDGAVDGDLGGARRRVARRGRRGNRHPPCLRGRRGPHADHRRHLDGRRVAAQAGDCRTVAVAVGRPTVLEAHVRIHPGGFRGRGMGLDRHPALPDHRQRRHLDGGSPPAPHAPALGVAPDADTLFLVTPKAGATVWVTRDAGRSWAAVGSPQEDGSTPPTLTFVSPSHGFARFQKDGSPLHIYETTDGGRTWAGPVVRDAVEKGMPYGGMAWFRATRRAPCGRATGRPTTSPSTIG